MKRIHFFTNRRMGVFLFAAITAFSQENASRPALTLSRDVAESKLLSESATERAGGGFYLGMETIRRRGMEALTQGRFGHPLLFRSFTGSDAYDNARFKTAIRADPQQAYFLILREQAPVLNQKNYVEAQMQGNVRAIDRLRYTDVTLRGIDIFRQGLSFYSLQDADPYLMLAKGGVLATKNASLDSLSRLPQNWGVLSQEALWRAIPLDPRNASVATVVFSEAVFAGRVWVGSALNDRLTRLDSQQGQIFLLDKQYHALNNWSEAAGAAMIRQGSIPAVGASLYPSSIPASPSVVGLPQYTTRTPFGSIYPPPSVLFGVKDPVRAYTPRTYYLPYPTVSGPTKPQH